MTNMVYCRGCGKEIHNTAPACPHCGALQELISQTKEVKPKADYGVALLTIPVVSTALIWGWVSNMNLLQSPSSTMDLIMLATILGTAIVAALEAGKVGMKTDRKNGTYSPTNWFFIICLLWVVGYPMYLLKRKYFGLANRLLAGFLVALVFVGSFGVMYMAIEDKKSEIRGGLEQMNQQLESLDGAKEGVALQSAQVEKQSQEFLPYDYYDPILEDAYDQILETLDEPKKSALMEDQLGFTPFPRTLS